MALSGIQKRLLIFAAVFVIILAIGYTYIQIEYYLADQAYYHQIHTDKCTTTSPLEACENSTLSANGTVSAVLTQGEGYTLYNVALACAASQNLTTGEPNASTNPWIYLSSTGAPQKNYNQNNTYAWKSGSSISISGIPCYARNGTRLSNLANATLYEGDLYIMYSTTVNPYQWIFNPFALLQLSAQ